MKILVSSCLMGQNVRYDGGHKNLDALEILSRYHELIPFCPEVAGGLSVPREPAEIAGTAEEILNEGAGRVLTVSGEDVTKEFLEGAGKALNICRERGIEAAILKENSPSCGSTHVYDSTFQGIKVPGSGITSELLRSNGIKVYNEHNFTELIPEECEYTISREVE